ncbi:peptidyl-prolyl cis-trans isomerase [Paucihalobacter sp.]|uniref:peptidyl-prolyl cis-trans isomerase n=1 Tax=Paucihalobacter sp. TaxID=2850405 RepID=UPI002FDF2C64
MKYNIFILSVFLAVFTSCQFFKPASPGEAIARVNESYLYQKDLQGVIPEGISQDDSLVMVSNYINKWALQILLQTGAERNLPDKKQEEFNKLVAQYKNDLYTKAYIEALVRQNIDETVSESESQEVYEQNKESFKLNEDLLKFRYIKIPKNALNLNEVTKRFKTFNLEDRRYLDSVAVQFNAYSLNDSVWIRFSQAIEKIPVVNINNKNELLKKSNFVQLKDSLNLYLMQINDVLAPNDYAPLEYVQPTVNQIVINKRKLELIKQLENDIIKDANRNKQFEVFN